jgi:hypothetical protein
MCLADSAVFALVEDRIWVNKIPRDEIEAASTFHPPKMLVLRMAGGAGKADLLPVDQPTITTLCYGETDEEADKVRRAVWELFVRSLRVTHDGVLFHDFIPTGGAIPNTEPDLVWPVIAQTYTVLADVREVA